MGKKPWGEKTEVEKTGVEKTGGEKFSGERKGPSTVNNYDAVSSAMLLVIR